MLAQLQALSHLVDGHERPMVQTVATVREIEAEGYGLFVRAVFDAPEICSALGAGRFVLADLGGLLSEALFPARIDGDQFEVLVPQDHRVARLEPNAKVSVLGPLGHGYHVPVSTRRLLLVADASRVPVLLPLVERSVGANWATTLLLSVDSIAQLYPLRLLPPAIEVHVCSADDSVGQTRDLADAFDDLIQWADHVCVATDPAVYPELANHVRDRRLAPATVFAEALISPLMACGVGACQGCAVATSRGVRLACTDGPVFDLLDLHGQ